MRVVYNIFWNSTYRSPSPFGACLKRVEKNALGSSLEVSVEGLENKKATPKSGFLVSGWQDSNLRPPGPKPGALTGLRYTPYSKLSPVLTITIVIRSGLEPETYCLEGSCSIQLS